MKDAQNKNLTDEPLATQFNLAMRTLLAKAPDCIPSDEAIQKHTLQEDEAAVAVLDNEADAKAMQVKTMLEESSSLAQVDDKLIIIPVAFGGILGVLVGIALCFVSLIITVLLTGLVLCVLKALFVALTDSRRFDDFDLKHCVNWWLEAIGIDTGSRDFKLKEELHGPGVLLAACAAPHIIGALGIHGAYGGVAYVR